MEGSVLITGGAGFLGRAILKRSVEEGWDARFTVMSRDDAKHAELQKRFPHVDAVLADVGTMPMEELAHLMRGFDTVIHAAASKYVDRSEHAAFETIRTNTIGSMNVAQAAIRARVPRVVGVSTDKAVAPLNNYGATKFLMERVFQEANRLSEQSTFTVCRYGNVVASTGSVLAIFMGLVAEGKPIRLTDPRMTRFWMSPSEAVTTVLDALDAPPGMVLIPKCRAMTMQDVALTALGYDEHDDLPEDGRVELIGLRPGEKMHEALLTRPESVRATEIRARGQNETYSPFEGGTFQRHLARFRAAEPGEASEYIILAPPDVPPMNKQPFEIVSDRPPGGWLTPPDLRAIVEEAKTI